MRLEYIDENLKEILDNPDSVLYLRPYTIGNKIALFAVIKESQGIYRRVQITKKQSKMTFPNEPIYWFYNGPGYLFLKDFIVVSANWVALNPTKMDGFKYRKIDEDKMFNMGIYATFNDGSAIFIERGNGKYLEKHGVLDKYNNLLKPYKEVELHFERYYVIERFFDNDNRSVIPNLLPTNDLKLEKSDFEELKYKDVDDKGNLERLGISRESFHQSYEQNNGFNTSINNHGVSDLELSKKEEKKFSKVLSTIRKNKKR